MRYEAGKEATFVPCSSAASRCIQMFLGRKSYSKQQRILFQFSFDSNEWLEDKFKVEKPLLVVKNYSYNVLKGIVWGLFPCRRVPRQGGFKYGDFLGILGFPLLSRNNIEKKSFPTSGWKLYCHTSRCGMRYLLANVRGSPRTRDYELVGGSSPNRANVVENSVMQWVSPRCPWGLQDNSPRNNSPADNSPKNLNFFFFKY